jgi:hypothetical protein
MNRSMSQSMPFPTLSFPVRRDRWDTVDFYLPLFIGIQAGGLVQIAIGIESFQRSPQWWWFGWFLIAWGLFDFVLGTFSTVLRIWRRYAERYELTDSEFVLHCGYSRQRIPFREISGVHPIKICRTTSALKPAVRIKCRKQPPAPESAHQGAVFEYDVPGFRRRIPIQQALSMDVSPVSLEAFLDELESRCPNLEREGPRFHPKPVTAPHV